MMRRLSLLAGLLAFAPTALAPCPTMAAEQQQAAREAVGKPVKAAEQLLRQKKHHEALAELAKAAAVPNKTPYEIYVIEATRAAVLLDSGDYAGAKAALEAVLATKILPSADARARMKTIVELDYQTKNYPAVIADADRYYRDDGSDPEPRTLQIQALYAQGDFAAAAKAIRAVLQDQARANVPPREDMLLMLLSCDDKQGDKADYIDTLETLVATYPKKEYWADLLAAVQKKPGFSRRLALDVDRLLVATGTMQAPGDYMEAAQLALQEGLPGDAKSLLDRGYAAGVLGKGGEAERQQRLVALADRQAAEDIRTLPQQARDAEAAATGLPWIKLGDAYASYGQYENAIAAFEKGLAKGGLKYPEEAKLHLGLAHLKAGQRAQARAVLGSVGGADGARDLARLWLIKSGAAG